MGKDSPTKYLKSLKSIRERCSVLLRNPAHLRHFDVRLGNLDRVVDTVVMLIKRVRLPAFRCAEPSPGPLGARELRRGSLSSATPSMPYRQDVAATVAAWMRLGVVIGKRKGTGSHVSWHGQETDPSFRSFFLSSALRPCPHALLSPSFRVSFPLLACALPSRLRLSGLQLADWRYSFPLALEALQHQWRWPHGVGD
jgi:hypothetical protein